MFRFLCKALLITKPKDSTRGHALVLRTISSSSESISGNLVNIDQNNLTVTYLMNSCGLPFKTATSLAQKIRIETTGRSDSVIELFRTNGFSNAHIANMITKHPLLLFADPVKTLKPKIQFFQSLGFSSSDLVKFLTTNHSILLRSLQNQIIPILNFLKTFVHTNENLICALKHCSQIISCNIKKSLEPKIVTLRGYGVPESNISKLIITQSKPLTLRVPHFEEVVAMVTKMGFDPSSRSFILAICTASVMSKQNWEKKREALMSFGWSEDEFLSAFKVQPMVMLTSEKKIRKLMDFFVNVLHLKSSDVAKCPNLFLLSLERRIIPRCSVLQVLINKGLIKKDLNMTSVLSCNKKLFDRRFVTRYEEKAPEVVKAYQGEMGFVGFDH